MPYHIIPNHKPPIFHVQIDYFYQSVLLPEDAGGAPPSAESAVGGGGGGGDVMALLDFLDSIPAAARVELLCGVNDAAAEAKGRLKLTPLSSLTSPTCTTRRSNSKASTALATATAE